MICVRRADGMVQWLGRDLRLVAMLSMLQTGECNGNSTACFASHTPRAWWLSNNLGVTRTRRTVANEQVESWECRKLREALRAYECVKVLERLDKYLPGPSRAPDPPQTSEPPQTPRKPPQTKNRANYHGGIRSLIKWAEGENEDPINPSKTFGRRYLLHLMEKYGHRRATVATRLTHAHTLFVILQTQGCIDSDKSNPFRSSDFAEVWPIKSSHPESE